MGYVINKWQRVVSTWCQVPDNQRVNSYIHLRCLYSRCRFSDSPIIHHMLCSPHLQVKEQCTGNGHLLTGPMATKCHLFPFSILCYAITILLQNNKCKYILRIRNHKTDFLSIQAKKIFPNIYF